MLSQGKALGGYFELELPNGSGLYYPDALKYQSARAAFYALLLHRKPKRVWMPYYICDTMLAPLKKAEVDIAFYSIGLDFQITDDIKLDADELLLYVNYFGICSENQKQLLDQFESQQIIFDNSQAFFCQPKECLATIYSPRKFFGVPDGGLLITALPIVEPKLIDERSIDRSIHLLKRLAGEPEDGYDSFLSAEETLKDIEPKKMSLLTERLLSSINYLEVKEKREENFKALDKNLSVTNKLSLPLSKLEGPMVYPYISTIEGNDLKEKLINLRCFVATYWLECENRLDGFETEKKIVSDLVLLPCDQRIIGTRFIETTLEMVMVEER